MSSSRGLRHKSRRGATASTSNQVSVASAAATTPECTRETRSSSKVPEASSSSEDVTSANAAEEAGTNDQSQTASTSSQRSTGSPEHCPICLGGLENKSFTNNCFHMFCFVCLKEWSKVKAECPLCKKPFSSIIYNVTAYDKYDMYNVEQRPPPAQMSGLLPYLYMGGGAAAFDRSFRYRTTLTMDHHYISLPHSAVRMHDSSFQRPSRRYPTGRPVRPVSTTEYRRQIYDTGRRVTEVNTNQRRRAASPTWFSSNPAQTHRLLPWLNRELNALLYNYDHQVSFVQELIMDLIKRFPINSEEFYMHISPFLRRRTRHFMHEFLSFARSPLTMDTYDLRAVYGSPSHTTSEGSSTDSDIVVVDDDEEAGQPVPNRLASAAAPSHTASFDSPYFRGSGNASRTVTSQSGWDSPMPGPSWDLGDGQGSSSAPVDVVDSDSSASTIIDPCYIHRERLPQSPQAARPNGHVDNDEDDNDAVIIVSYDKPWAERSPIHLSSSEDETTRFVKCLKEEHKKSKKLPPSLFGFYRERSPSTSPSYARSRLPYAGPSSRTKSTSQSRSPIGRRSTSPLPRTSRDGKNSTSDMKRTKKSKKRHHDHDDRPESKSSSRKRSSPKKHRTEVEGDSSSQASIPGDPRSKRHKHKKQKKKKDHKHREGSSQKSTSAVTTASSGNEKSASKERDSSSKKRCKKHPSGHKRSQSATVTAAEDNRSGGPEKEAAERNEPGSDCASDSPSSASSSDGPTITASSGPAASTRSSTESRLRRVEQVLNDRRRLQIAAVMCGRTPSSFSDMTQESLSQLADILASQTAAMVSPPHPSTSSANPVVIDSDDSDQLQVATSQTQTVSGENLRVEKTVVVPCSSTMGLPTPALDRPQTPSMSAANPVSISDEEECIDVESISSESKSEVVDVELLDDSSKDSCASAVDLSHTSNSTFQEVSAADCQRAGNEGTQPAADAHALRFTFSDTRSRKAPTRLKNFNMASLLNTCHPFSVENILNRDTFMGSSQASQQLSLPKSTLVSLPQYSTCDFALPQSCSQSLLAEAGNSQNKQNVYGYRTKKERLLGQNRSSPNVHAASSLAVKPVSQVIDSDEDLDCPVSFLASAYQYQMAGGSCVKDAGASSNKPSTEVNHTQAKSPVITEASGNSQNTLSGEGHEEGGCKNRGNDDSSRGKTDNADKKIHTAGRSENVDSEDFMNDEDEEVAGLLDSTIGRNQSDSLSLPRTSTPVSDHTGDSFEVTRLTFDKEINSKDKDDFDSASNDSADDSILNLSSENVPNTYESLLEGGEPATSFAAGLRKGNSTSQLNPHHGTVFHPNHGDKKSNALIKNLTSADIPYGNESTDVSNYRLVMDISSERSMLFIKSVDEKEVATVNASTAREEENSQHCISEGLAQTKSHEHKHHKERESHTRQDTFDDTTDETSPSCNSLPALTADFTSVSHARAEREKGQPDSAGRLFDENQADQCINQSCDEHQVDLCADQSVDEHQADRSAEQSYNEHQADHSAEDSCNEHQADHSTEQSCNEHQADHSAEQSCNEHQADHSAEDSCNEHQADQSSKRPFDENQADRCINQSCDELNQVDLCADQSVDADHSAEQSCNEHQADHSAEQSCNEHQTDHSAEDSCNEHQADQSAKRPFDENQADQSIDHSSGEHQVYKSAKQFFDAHQADQSTEQSFDENQADQSADHSFDENQADQSAEQSFDENQADQSAEQSFDENQADQSAEQSFDENQTDQNAEQLQQADQSAEQSFDENQTDQSAEQSFDENQTDQNAEQLQQADQSAEQSFDENQADQSAKQSFVEHQADQNVETVI